MNKRKAVQAQRTGSRGRKRIAKAMKGGRVVVVTPAARALLELMKPQLPIALKRKMEAQIKAVEAANAAGGLQPVTPPVIDLNAPYKPGLSTVDRMVAAATPEPEPAKEHKHEREKARRLRQLERRAA